MRLRINLQAGWPRASVSVRPAELREAFFAGKFAARDFFDHEFRHPTVHAVLLNYYYPALRGESPAPPFRDEEGFLRDRDHYARGSVTTFGHSLSLVFKEFIQSPVSLGHVPLEMARYPEGSVDLIPEPDLAMAIQALWKLSDSAYEVIRETMDRLSDTAGVLRPDYLADEDVFDASRYLILVNLSPSGGLFGFQVLNPLLDSAIERGLIREAWNEKHPDQWPDRQRLYHASSIFPISNLVNAFLPRVSLWRGKLSDRSRAEAYREARDAATGYLGQPVCEVCHRPLDGRRRVRCRECRDRLGGQKFPELL